MVCLTSHSGLAGQWRLVSDPTSYLLHGLAMNSSIAVGWRLAHEAALGLWSTWTSKPEIHVRHMLSSASERLPFWQLYTIDMLRMPRPSPDCLSWRLSVCSHG